MSSLVSLEPTQSEPAQSEPAQLEPAQLQPVQIEPTQKEPAQLEPAQVQPVQIESTQKEPAQLGPTQMEPAQLQPVQIEPTQKEPTQLVPTQMDPAAVQPSTESCQEEQEFDRVKLLEQELRIRTDERENYKNRIKQMVIEMAALQKKDGDNVEVTTENTTSQRGQTDREENTKLRDMIANLKETIREKTSSLARKNLQTEALETQVAALKEVTLLSKGMLDIRNTENMKLKEQIDLMMQKIAAERVRHNTMLKKTEQAASINNQLKEEYHKQVALFGELKERYERKVVILKEEIDRLETLQGLTPP